jgi:hypothetical protein
MFLGRWINFAEEYFDTAHYPNCLVAYPFQGGEYYLLFIMVEVNFILLITIIRKIVEMSLFLILYIQ